MDSEVLTEVPQNLQMLVRLVVRGFYSIEDVLIVDMLVRNLCMSEDDLCELLKFDRKMLRQRINTLKADKLLQARLKMVTLEDNKTQREQYYFINYKSFVNVVKYKLDHIRKKLEMEERDQTSRASFICDNCQRTYTDLEADQLLDMVTGQLLCIICRCEVQEDMSGMPRHDSRVALTRFNEQMESLFNLLREVENIKLAAEFSEPKPQDFSSIKKLGQPKSERRQTSDAGGDKAWSGDATRKQGFQVEGSIDVNINTKDQGEELLQTKSNPIWLTEASSFITTNITANDSSKTEQDIVPVPKKSTNDHLSGGGKDDVFSILLAHERKAKRGRYSDSDSDDSVEEVTKKPVNAAKTLPCLPPLVDEGDSVEEILNSDSDDDGEPLISVGGEKYPITSINSTIIAKMTEEEKNQYITVYQEYMASMDD